MNYNMGARSSVDDIPINKTGKPVLPDADDDEELYDCRQGCGRKFKKSSLAKHENACKKVFQDKRPEFNSADQRKDEELMRFEKDNRKKKGRGPGPSNNANQKGGKWKQQSEAFRAGLRAARGEELTESESKALNKQDDHLILCKFCGRKFNEKAAERHIAFCESKSRVDKNKVAGKGRR